MASPNDLRAKKMRLKALNESIPRIEDRLDRMIKERAGVQAVIRKVESRELAKNHDGLCGEQPSIPAESSMNPFPKCERFYKHTGPHSWEGGGVG